MLYFRRRILSSNDQKQRDVYVRRDERPAWENEIVRYKSITGIGNGDSGQKRQPARSFGHGWIRQGCPNFDKYISTTGTSLGRWKVRLFLILYNNRIICVLTEKCDANFREDL